MTDNFALVLGVAGIVLFVYGPLQWFLVDLLRQKLFELRDSTFDYAAEHGLFSDQRYVDLRNFLNGSIRWAEQANGLVLPKAILSVLLVSGVVKKDNRLHRVMSDKNTPMVFRSAFERAMRVISIVSLLRSPVLLMVLMALIPFLPIIAVVLMLSGRGLPTRRVQQAVEHTIEADVAAA